MRAAAILTVGAALLAAACTDVMTEPGVPVAIQVGPLPYPSVILGDSLRDTMGVAVPVPVTVFDGRGQPVENPQLVFLALGTDPNLQVDPGTGHVVGLRPGEGRVIVSAGGLQSAPLVLAVTPRPDTLFATSALRDTIEFIDFRDHRTELSVQLMADTGEVPLTPVRQFLVDFRIVDPSGLPTQDSTRVLLVNERGIPSTRDTTGTDGAASRSVRLSPWIVRPPPDSVLVEASAVQLDGTPVAGSPVRFVIVIESVAAP